MPLAKQCDISTYRENISELVRSGYDADQAVAIAHKTLREACKDEGKPTPATKGMTRDYLTSALAKAKEALGDKFAQIHASARGRAGGLASARSRATSIEKSFMVGPERLSDLELDDAFDRAELWAAADERLCVKTGGETLAERFWAEKARRDELKKKKAKKGEPDSASVHVNKPLGEVSTWKSDTALAKLADAVWPKIEDLCLDMERLDAIHREVKRTHTKALLGPLEAGDFKTIVYVEDGDEIAKKHSMEFVEGGNYMAYPFIPRPELWIDCYLEPEMWRYILFHEFMESYMMDIMGLKYDMAHDIANHVFERAARQRHPVIPDDANLPSMPPRSVEFAESEAPAEVMAVEGGKVRLVGDLVAMSALALEPGDMVELTADLSGDLIVAKASTSTVAAPVEQVRKSAEEAHEKLLHNTVVPFVGPASAQVVFVSGAPNELELARGEAFVGADGVAFAERYLKPLGLAKAEVVTGFACPVLPYVPPHEIGLEQTGPWQKHVEAELAKWPNAAIVAIGKAAHDALGDRALLWMPHPLAARANEARYTQPSGKSRHGEIERKLNRIRKALDEGFVFQDNEPSQAAQLRLLPGRSGETGFVKVTKSAEEKQIVYGVVLDPYEIDSQGEWVPPAVIEKAAHDYLRLSRVIGREHLRRDSAELVESHVVDYPTPEDYLNAMALLPHSAYSQPYGNDTVHSGAWIAGVRLDDAGWAAYKKGDITGFSIGGFSSKTKMDQGQMPKVEFVPRVSK